MRQSSNDTRLPRQMVQRIQNCIRSIKKSLLVWGKKIQSPKKIDMQQLAFNQKVKNAERRWEVYAPTLSFICGKYLFVGLTDVDSENAATIHVAKTNAELADMVRMLVESCRKFPELREAMNAAIRELKINEQ
jgi:cob(I)alamin adenosyltransferase